MFIFELCFSFSLFCQEVNSLLVSSSDIKLVEEVDSSGETKGYHLFVKKKPGIESIMLTETTKDPLGQEPNLSLIHI